MSLLTIGLFAQTSDLQSFKDNVDKIVKSKDTKEKKQEKLTDALKAYGTSLAKKNPGKQGEDLISREQLDEILNTLKGASVKIDPEKGENEEKPKGFAYNWDEEKPKSLQEAFVLNGYSVPGSDWCGQCTTTPWHGMPGVVLISEDMWWWGPCIVTCGTSPFLGLYCSGISQ